MRFWNTDIKNLDVKDHLDDGIISSNCTIVGRDTKKGVRDDGYESVNSYFPVKSAGEGPEMRWYYDILIFRMEE